MNVEELIGKNVTLTKLESTRYRDGHPNGIEPGYVACGKLISARVGGIAEVIGPRGFWDYFHTSLIKKIEGNLIYTLNSVYEVEELSESQDKFVANFFKENKLSDYSGRRLQA